MVKKPAVIYDVLSNDKIDIPEEYKKEFLKEILEIDIKREWILSYLLVAVNIALLFYDTLASAAGLKNHVFLGFTYVHFILLIVPISFLYLTQRAGTIDEGSIRLTRLYHIHLNIFVLILCSMITIKGEVINQQPFAYIIAIFAVSSLVLLGKTERVITYLPPYLMNIIGILVVQKEEARQFQDIFFFTLLTIIALFISYMNYKLSIKNFISNKIVIEKNLEIDNLYKATEEMLKKRTQELNETVEYDKLRTAFFANLSHELRTPLNVIFSAQQMLDILLKEERNCKSNVQIDQYMDIIKQNCYRLIRLINNLIDMTKIDAGYMQFKPVSCDIVEVVEDITLSVAKYIEDRNMRLTFDTEVEEKTMACDPDQIERIMLNLLSNATKFTPEGGEIYVNIYEREDGVSISVRDTGIGIPEGMKECIFERFVQVDKTTSRNREGSGIGLSIVKALVDMHGGSISLITEPQKGSEFIINIPDRILPDSEAAEMYEVSGRNFDAERINIEFSDIYR